MIFFVKTPYLKSGLGPFMLCLKEYDFLFVAYYYTLILIKL